MIKKCLKRLFPNLYKALVDIKLRVFGYAVKSYSQEGEDMIMRRLFEGKNRGFYVDVGAHHPMRFSNTYMFYKKGWCGINVEPNPESRALFKKWRKRDINLTLGVSDEAGDLTYFMFDEPALNSFDEDLSKSRVKETPYKLVDVKKVKVKRLSDILENHLPIDVQIDFMSIDTEGHDFQVVNSNDWNKYRPTYLLVECLGSDLASIAKNPIAAFLDDKGYAIYAKTHNTLIFKDLK